MEEIHINLCVAGHVDVHRDAMSAVQKSLGTRKSGHRDNEFQIEDVTGGNIRLLVNLISSTDILPGNETMETGKENQSTDFIFEKVAREISENWKNQNDKPVNVCLYFLSTERVENDAETIKRFSNFMNVIPVQYIEQFSSAGTFGGMNERITRSMSRVQRNIFGRHTENVLPTSELKFWFKPDGSNRGYEYCFGTARQPEMPLNLKDLLFNSIQQFGTKVEEHWQHLSPQQTDSSDNVPRVPEISSTVSWTPSKRKSDFDNRNAEIDQSRQLEAENVEEESNILTQGPSSNRQSKRSRQIRDEDQSQSSKDTAMQCRPETSSSQPSRTSSSPATKQRASPGEPSSSPIRKHLTRQCRKNTKYESCSPSKACGNSNSKKSSPNKKKPSVPVLNRTPEQPVISSLEDQPAQLISSDSTTNASSKETAQIQVGDNIDDDSITNFSSSQLIQPTVPSHHHCRASSSSSIDGSATTSTNEVAQTMGDEGNQETSKSPIRPLSQIELTQGLTEVTVGLAELTQRVNKIEDSLDLILRSLNEIKLKLGM